MLDSFYLFTSLVTIHNYGDVSANTRFSAVHNTCINPGLQYSWNTTLTHAF